MGEARLLFPPRNPIDGIVSATQGDDDAKFLSYGIADDDGGDCPGSGPIGQNAWLE